MTNDESNSSVPLMNSPSPLELPSGSVSSVSHTSEDIFATMHYMYAPIVTKALPKLSKKELARIVTAIVEVPPSQKTINNFTEVQKNVYYTLEKVCMAKYFMMYQVALNSEMKKEQERIEKEANEPTVHSGDNGTADSVSKE